MGITKIKTFFIITNICIYHYLTLNQNGIVYKLYTPVKYNIGDTLWVK